MSGTAPELVLGFGLYNFSVSEVHRPASREELAALLARLEAGGRPVVFRGAGQSYGPVNTNPSGPVIDFSRLNRIVSFDAGSGVVRAEARSGASGANGSERDGFVTPRS